MADFSEVVKSWETFYLLVGTAAVTLIGLLFVAITIHIDVIQRQSNADLELFGVLTFNSFFYVLVLAILFVIPGQSPVEFGILTFVLGGAAFLNTTRQFVKARRLEAAGMPHRMVGRFLGPLLCLALVMAAAVAILVGYYQMLYGLVAVNVFLLGSASQNAWVLLMRPGDDEQTTRRTPPRDTDKRA